MTHDPDQIDALLRARKVSAVADDGFSDRLLARVPALPSPKSRWPIPTFSVLGLALTGFALVSSHTTFSVAALLQTHGVLALAGLAAILAWTTCAWALLSAKAR